MVRIPQEYQEVEYLESTGTQWIDTSIAPLNLDFEILVDYVWLPLNVNNWTSPFGARLNSSNNRADYVFRNGGGYYGKGYQSVKSLTNIKNDKNRNIVSLSRNSALRNGVNDASSEFNNTYAINYDVYLFSTNDSGSAINNFVGRIYSAYIKLEDNYAFYGIPCYRKSDNEIGMYDTVTGVFFTNQGTGTFLKGNDVNYDTVNLMESRRRILLNTPHLESISGATASFETDMSAKLKECKVHFTPIQEGTGDPSPDNVRPIHGWDSVTVTRCGKNLLNPDDENWGQYTINPTGGYISESDRICTDYIPCNEDETYTFSGTVKGSNSQVLSFAGIAGFDENKEYVGRNAVNFASKVSYTVPSGVRYIRAFEEAPKYPKITMKVWCNTLKRQLELSSTATDYEFYQAQSLTIPFPQTIYGGYVDLVKGEVVEELSIIDLGTVSLSQYSKSNHCWSGAIAYMKFGNAIELSELYCDSYKPLSKKSILSDGEDLSIWPYNTGQRRLIIRNDSYIQEDRTYAITSFKESLQGVMACIPLATPTTYPLDPVTIRTLRGMNNIWSDANGNIEVKFWTH